MLRNLFRASLCLAVCLTLTSLASPAWAGQFFRGGAVGGVAIDAEGVLSNPQMSDEVKLMELWQSREHVIAQDLKEASELRFVSLRGIEAEVAAATKENLPVPDAVQFLGGLTRIEYVLVDPEKGDILMAGPAEPWKMDKRGNFVGQETGQSIVLLDDLMVALRAARKNLGAGMSCSIDPTAEGLKRVQQVAGRLNSAAGPKVAARQIEQALGYQTISVNGIPANSHFARTIVAADFRMKRLAMNFDKSPVRGMPSYLQMIGGSGRGMQNLLPRWWMAPNYEAVVRDPAGLVWHLKGQGVKCMTEEDFVAEDGSRKQTGKAGGAAQKWADNFTEKFDELAVNDSTFGQMRNVMDLAVVTTLIEQQGMPDRVNLNLDYLAGKAEIDEYNAPTRVASQASFIKKGSNWIISASGGVQISPGEALQKMETANLPVAGKAAAATSKSTWWWDAS